VTAEPHAAVKLPSRAIVAENALRKSTEGVARDIMRIAEQGRASAVDRAAQADLQAEREAQHGRD
jgi:hypothetical protein